MSAGRPTRYSPELAEQILSRMAEGETLTEICKGPGMPTRGTVWFWTTRPENADFSDAYTQAKFARLEAMADEIMDIADNATNDWMERQSKDGNSAGWEFNGEAVRRSHLRVESRKWLLARLHRDYRDKLETKHDVGGSLAELVAASYAPKP